MDSREEVLKALHEGKVLTSSATGLRYKLIDGLLHSRNSEHKEWTRSELMFFHPPSWLNLQS